MNLRTAPDAPHAFEVWIESGSGHSLVVEVRGPGPTDNERLTRLYRPPGREHADYVDLFERLGVDFGTAVPRARRSEPMPASAAPYEPLLTRNLSPRIRYGYGDPALLRVEQEGAYYLVVTSNDAPDAFPLLRSTDLHDWQTVGFVFPAGSQPSWAATGEDLADFWAPELHRLGTSYLLCFAARTRDGDLAIGIASAARPEGPFQAPEAPLLSGGVIDPHILVDGDGSAILFWKEDSNDIWPSLLSQLLHEHGAFIPALFEAQTELRTASLTAALWPFIERLGAMERFFVQQTLIEAVVTNYGAVRNALERLHQESEAALRTRIDKVLQAMRTPVHAQRLSADGMTLTGERKTVLVNDLAWEGHLIEGNWVTRQGGLYYLFYSGNDFSTADYGIGVAVAETPFGPYRKMEQPLLRSSASWWGPGHPSVATGPDGVPRLFLHAFFPGTGGYKTFRALLSVRVAFGDGVVEIVPPQ